MSLLFSLLLFMLVGHIGGCRLPFENVSNGCYFYNEDHHIDSYQGAASECEKYSGHLAMIKDRETNRALLSHFFSTGIKVHKILLDAKLNDLGLFQWSDGSLVRDTFEGWAPGQQNGSGGCMGYSKLHDLEWDNFPCENYTELDILTGYICEKEAMIECTEPFVDLDVGCYYLAQDFKTFNNSRNTCNSMDSHLIYITSEEEQTAIAVYLTLNEIEYNVWIGASDLYRNDTMYWLNGVEVDSGYTNWASGEPDHGDANDVYMSYHGSKEWYDNSDRYTTYFMCEKDI